MAREMPPRLEIECLKALWSLGEGTVHDVVAALGERKLKYTTVMTLLDRLEGRGAVVRKKRGRSFVYTPKVSRETLQGIAVDELINRFFEGSEGSLEEFLKMRRL
jgi:predicted transcriptional regulator